MLCHVVAGRLKVSQRRLVWQLKLGAEIGAEKNRAQEAKEAIYRQGSLSGLQAARKQGSLATLQYILTTWQRAGLEKNLQAWVLAMIRAKARARLEAAEQRILVTQNGSFKMMKAAQKDANEASIRMLRRVVTKWAKMQAQTSLSEWRYKIERKREAVAQRSRRASLQILNQVLSRLMRGSQRSVVMGWKAHVAMATAMGGLQDRSEARLMETLHEVPSLPLSPSILPSFDPCVVSECSSCG